jgi:molybdopterin converting factor small subunit
MSVKINIPSYLMPYTDDAEAVETDGSTVGQCIDHLIKQFPGLKKMVFDKKGELLDYVSIYADGDFVYGDGLTRPVKDGDELHLFYVIGGG